MKKIRMICAEILCRFGWHRWEWWSKVQITKDWSWRHVMKHREVLYRFQKCANCGAIKR